MRLLTEAFTGWWTSGTKLDRKLAEPEEVFYDKEVRKLYTMRDVMMAGQLRLRDKRRQAAAAVSEPGAEGICADAAASATSF